MTKKFLPFKAYTYNQDKVDSLADVVTPPYDVINPEMQERFYDKSPYNFCRVDFAREAGDLKYQAAAQTLQSWIANEVVTKDSRPALYFHAHGFKLPDGGNATRYGFFAARRIEDFSEGGIKPHEKTLDGPKEDRLKLMRATQAQLSPIFSLYSDPEKRIASAAANLFKTTPLADFIFEDGERHRLWKCRDEKIFELIEMTLADRPLFIADGHHRYETALNYRNELIHKNPDLPEDHPARYVFMYFSCMEDDGLVILPIHRALHGLSGFSAADFLGRLQQAGFDIHPAGATDESGVTEQLKKSGQNAHAFCVLTDDGRANMISLSRAKWQQSEIYQRLPAAVADLDVSVLHRLVLEHILGLSEESQARQDNIDYIKSTAEALKRGRDSSAQVVFVLNPTRIHEMRGVAGAGLKMPQKSTFFYPKIVSGLLWYGVD